MIPEPGALPAGTITGRNPLRRLRGQLYQAFPHGGAHVARVLIEEDGVVYRVTETRDAPERAEREMWTPLDGPVDALRQARAAGDGPQPARRPSTAGRA